LIALTATADKATRQDILEQLKVPTAKQFLTSFDRKNIYLEVRPANDRVGQIMDFIDTRPDQAGIIYCLSRKSTEQLQERLEQKGLKVHAYHAGLDFVERTKVQEDFIFDRVKVVCATVAFGMGIDKSNVRWVIHYNMPKNLEGYYQEIGRAGRDGSKARALLFHSYADVLQLRRFMDGATNEDLQVAKLERMKQFSEATSCRRRILLSYFGELLKTNCGNCDICKNPPQFFNGTILAQKALSVMARLREREAMGTVIDVLRGAKNAHVLDKKYDLLPSYGIGGDISWKDWQHYIVQLIDQGFCEIAFHEHNALRLTNFSKAVLFQGMEVQMSRALETKEMSPAKKESTRTPKKAGSLFERLRLLRLKLALEENIPAYLVFSDATLKEIEAQRPLSETEFLGISGVGQRKLEVYGDAFIAEVKAFMESKGKGNKKSDTLMVTYELYQNGMEVEDIATERNLKAPTIFSHLAQLYQEGKEIDLYRYVSKEEVAVIKNAKKILQAPEGLKPYFEHLEEKVPYSNIRLALAILEREKG
jgi:ATP-dependent DNA helicase RecQ